MLSYWHKKQNLYIAYHFKRSFVLNIIDDSQFNVSMHMEIQFPVCGKNFLKHWSKDLVVKQIKILAENILTRPEKWLSSWVWKHAPPRKLGKIKPQILQFWVYLEVYKIYQK